MVAAAGLAAFAYMRESGWWMFLLIPAAMLGILGFMGFVQDVVPRKPKEPKNQSAQNLDQYTPSATPTEPPEQS